MNMTIRAMVLVVVGILAGCAVPAPIEPRMDPWPDARVNLDSQDLYNNVVIKQAIEDRRNGILYVTFPIRSIANYDLHIDARYTFFNANGGVCYQSGWESLKTLVANIPADVTFNSTDSTAVTWRCDLRWSR
jgi:hypothetical protein